MTYHNEVVGSLLRPAYLLEAQQQYASGQISAPAFKLLEDRAVDEAIALQEAAGIDVLTDGEMRRYAFFGHLIDAFDGFDKVRRGPVLSFRNEKGEQLAFQAPVVVEKLRWHRNMCAEEWIYLRARTSHPAKITMANVLMAGTYDHVRSKAAYPTRDAYLADLVDFSRREIRELLRLGCTSIQFDAPIYASFLDPQMRADYQQRGVNPDRQIDRLIELDNAIMDGFSGVTFSLHICRGNNRSMFLASGDYEPISRLFSRSHFQRFLLEYDDERSGGFVPLRHVPDDRFVVLGLVTTKKPVLESADELRQRIQEAARYIPLERLGLSPQCGFASTIEGNQVSFDDQRRKLELVVNVAREIWGD